MRKSRWKFVTVAVVAVSLPALVYRASVEQSPQRPVAPAKARGPVGVEPGAANGPTVPAVGSVPDDLVRYARSVAGPRFGGLWLATIPETGYRVGLREGNARDVLLISRAFRKSGIPGEVVSVAYSEEQLNRLRRKLELRLGKINLGTLVPVSIGLRPDLNAVQITAPLIGSSVDAQRRFVYGALTQFGSAVRLRTGSAVAITLPCRSVFCDPPLRAGLWIYGSFAGCTGGFIVRSITDQRLYQLTAGHCQYLWNGTWLTDFVNGSAHRVGVIHNRRFDAIADAGIVRIENVAGWKPRAWVAVRPDGERRNDAYSITGDSIPVVGQRVCSSGASLGSTSCGVVTRTGVAVYYRDQKVTVYGLVEANFCSQPGDSGSPVFAGHTAYGIVSGQISRCDSLFEPIRTAAAAMHVRVARDAV